MKAEASGVLYRLERSGWYKDGRATDITRLLIRRETDCFYFHDGCRGREVKIDKRSTYQMKDIFKTFKEAKHALQEERQKQAKEVVKKARQRVKRAERELINAQKHLRRLERTK
jgi:hypothetical protein